MKAEMSIHLPPLGGSRLSSDKLPSILTILKILVNKKMTKKEFLFLVILSLAERVWALSLRAKRGNLPQNVPDAVTFPGGLEEAVQGRGRYTRTRRRSSIPTRSRPLPAFSGGGSWAEPLLKTAHGRIGFPNAMHRVWGPLPTEGVRLRGCVKSGTGILPVGFRGIGVPPMLHGRDAHATKKRLLTHPLRASPSCFRPPPLVPGLFWFRARVILLAAGPTRPIQRLPVRGKVPTFPHPEPPLLLVLLGGAPSPYSHAQWGV